MSEDVLKNYAPTQEDSSDRVVQLTEEKTKQSPTIITDNSGIPLLERDSIINSVETEMSVLDDTWAKHAFMVPDSDLSADDNKWDRRNRYYSTAERKFTDTRFGGNIGLNARPQYCPYSDIRIPGRVPQRNPVTLDYTGGGYGLGRWYSDSLDDHAQRIYLRFGVPQFSALTTFLGKAFSPQLTAMARTGRGVSIWYNLGEIAGLAVPFAIFPVLSTAIIAGKLIGTFFSRPSSKFYTMKPTMFMYWEAVGMLVNAIAVNSGLLPRWMPLIGKQETQKMGTPYEIDQELAKTLNSLMPDIYSDDGFINIFAAASKAQRTANWQFAKDWEMQSGDIDPDEFWGRVQKEHEDKVTKPPGEHTVINFLRKTVMFGFYGLGKRTSTTMVKDKDGNDVPTTTVDQAAVERNPKEDSDSNNKYDKDGNIINDTSGKAINSSQDDFMDYFHAEFMMGSAFAPFIVNSTGSVGESFSNSATESDLSNKFNSTSSTAREARFSFAEGNVGDGMVSNAIEGVLGAFKDVATGALSGMTLGIFDGVMGLAGSGFIDVPKHWQSSNVRLPQAQYTMKLISPYNNVISRIQNIYLPFCAILAGAVPLSTGNQSYTSPFLCQLFDRGRCQIQLGMIDSLTVTRGGGANLPFDKRGRPLCIEVSFSITDLSSILHMPVGTGKIFSGSIVNPIANNPTIDEDNILMDYLAVLAGQDHYSQIYAMPKAALKMAKTWRNIQPLTSKAYWASLVHEETTTGLLSYLLPVGRLLDAALPGTNMVSRDLL